MDFFGKQQFECVLLDLDLPDSGGSNLLKKIKNEYLHDFSPIVAMSVSESVEDVLTAIRNGAQDYLVKGKFSSEDFHRAVEKAVGKSDRNIINPDERLRESEKRYRLLFENNPSPMVIYDFNTLQFTDVNEACCLHYGYSREEFLTMKITDIGSQKDADAIVEKVKKSDNARTTYSNWKHRKKDGSEILVETVSHRLDIEDENSRIVLVNDITERERIAEDLRDSEERFRANFEQAAVGIAHVSLEGKWILVNDRLCNITGYTKDELLQLTFQDITHPDDLEKDLNLVSKVLSGEIQTYLMEKRYFHKDGSIVWVNITVSLVRDFDAKPKYFISVIEDISRRKNAEENLRFEKERFEKLATASPSVICSLRMSADGQFSFVFVSQASEDIYGFTPQEIQADANLIFDRINPEDSAQVNESILRSMLTMSVWNSEFRYLHPQKGEVWIEGFSAPVLESDNSTIWHGIINDITKRKLAEENLRFEKERFENIALALPSAIFTFRLSPEGKMSLPYSSPPTKDIYGFTPEELTEDSLKIFNCINPEDLELNKEAIYKSAKDLTLYHDISRYHHPQKGERWIEVYSMPALEPDGSLVWHGVANDVTQRVQTEEQIAESEKIYRLMFEGNPLPMWVCDIETLQFLEVNNSAISKYGYTREEFLSMNLLDFRPAEKNPTVLEIIESFKKEEFEDSPENSNKIITTQHIKKDGTLIDVEVISHKIMFEGRNARFAMANDITERLRAEKALLEASLFNEQIINNVEEGIILLDKELRYVVLNRFLENQIGIKKEALIGKTPFEVFPSLRNEIVFENMQRALHGEKVRAADNEIYVPSKNESVWASSIYSPHYTADNEISGVIITVTDVSDRKKYEQEILQLNESLEQKVVERTSALNAVNKELESFSYSVSHDLRAPLRAIDGFSAALLEDYEEKLDEEGKNYLNRVRSASQKMAQLIDDLLKLSRLSRGELRRTKVNLSQIVTEITVQLQEYQPKSSVEQNIEPDIYTVADEHLIRIALENLLSNAWKFTSKKETAQIIFGKNAENGETVYFVKDNGAGFDMQFSDKLFGAFQRLHTIQEFDGTGIGLATVQRIINRHGGKIWAESKNGEGATFYFSLGK